MGNLKEAEEDEEVKFLEKHFLDLTVKLGETN